MANNTTMQEDRAFWLDLAHRWEQMAQAAASDRKEEV
jgi:hypothetical protein